MPSSSSTADGKPYSRNSTPATDVSPPGSPDFVLPPPSEETLRRRAQSDRASIEIGNRMLKGWAMLSEECLNDNCWAIPLVRPPRARLGADPDPRKECVICGAVYVTNENGRLVAQQATTRLSTTPQPNTHSRSSEVVQPAARNTSQEPRTGDVTQNARPTQITNAGFSTLDRTPVSHPPPKMSTISTFTSAEDALGGALETLSQRLVQISLASDLNTRQVKDTAEAMEAIMKALNTARQLKGSD